MTPFVDRASVEGRRVYVPVAGSGAVRLSLTHEEWARLGWLYGFIALLHIAGWSAYLQYSAQYPAMVRKYSRHAHANRCAMAIR